MTMFYFSVDSWVGECWCSVMFVESMDKRARGFSMENAEALPWPVSLEASSYVALRYANTQSVDSQF